MSLFAAQAGARRVYAVEASGFHDLARQNAEKNGFADVIRVVHGRIEDVALPEQADVIVSEWMGFYLLHESMLDSVIVGRDRWVDRGLKSSGSQVRLSSVGLGRPLQCHA